MGSNPTLSAIPIPVCFQRFSGFHHFPRITNVSSPVGAELFRTAFLFHLAVASLLRACIDRLRPLLESRHITRALFSFANFS